jgi:hypothetical protein
MAPLKWEGRHVMHIHWVDPLRRLARLVSYCSDLGIYQPAPGTLRKSFALGGGHERVIVWGRCPTAADASKSNRALVACASR